MRPYFAFERIRDGVLSTSAELYGVRFERRTDVETWHASVECFDVLDGEAVVARFFLDMHPRENKFKHAAMFDLSVAGDDVLPEAVLVCNFPEPNGDDPALLLHDEVTTFFHEFGHLLHHLFAGRQTFTAFSGIATEWDFVEVPSQAYEEWAWAPEVLARFATHVETGAPIPADLVERMRAADACGRAGFVLGQMYFAQLSLGYYDRDPSTFDPLEKLKELRAMLCTPHEEGTHFHVAFGHLNGYSALYYTYMWSLVIAKDVVAAFGGDWLDRATAQRYREAILAPGGSRDAAELVRAFLGRDYAFDAFADWLAAS